MRFFSTTSSMRPLARPTSILQNAFSLITNIVTALFIVVSVMLLNPARRGRDDHRIGGRLRSDLPCRAQPADCGPAKSRLVFFIEQTKIVNESLGAIKEILVLRIQNFFRGGFERSSRSVRAGRWRARN